MEPPHTYKEQRLLEKKATASRERMLDRGDLDLPPICGYTYRPRPTKQQKANKAWKPTDTVCQRNAGANTDHPGKGFCDYHTWAVTAETNSRTAPRNEVAYAMKSAAERARFFGNPRNVDPHGTLLEEIQRSASIVAFLEEKLQKMRDDEGWSDAAIMTQKTLKDGVKPSVWMDLYNSERDHLVKTCIAAIKAGVAERKVQIAEQQARLIAAMMFAFMHDPDLALTPDQIFKAPSIIRKHMMQLPQANPAAVDPAQVLASANSRTTSQVIEANAHE